MNCCALSVSSLVDVKVRQSWVSSAYKWYRTPCRTIRSPSGDVYATKRRVYATKRCMPQRGVYATKRRVYATKRSVCHKEVYATKRRVYVTKRCMPQRGECMSQRGVCHKEESVCHKEVYATKRRVYVTKRRRGIIAQYCYNPKKCSFNTSKFNLRSPQNGSIAFLGGSSTYRDLRDLYPPTFQTLLQIYRVITHHLWRYNALNNALINLTCYKGPFPPSFCVGVCIGV